MKKYHVWYNSNDCAYYEIAANSKDEAETLAEERFKKGESFDGEGISSDYELTEAVDTDEEVDDDE